MDKAQARRSVFALKLAAVGLNIFSVVWLCVYTFVFFPKTMQVHPDSLVGVFAAAFASGIAVAVILVIILYASVAAAVFAGCGGVCAGLEKKYSPLGGKEIRKRFWGYRIAGDFLLAAAGVIALVFGFSLGKASVLPLLPSLIAAFAVFAAIAAAEIVQGMALKKRIHSNAE